MKEVKIYCLVDPSTHEICYVGVTVWPLQSRLNQHISEARRSTATHKLRWLRKLAKENLTPPILLLCVTNEANWMEAEIYWISYFKGLGCPLTNSTEGGRGLLSPSQETRLKISRAHLGKILDADHKRAIGDSNKLRPNGMLGKKNSAESNRQRSVAMKRIRAQQKQIEVGES